MEHKPINIPLSRLYSGKVRDLYRLNEEEVLLVASDRISAFDYILPTLVPDKGKILTKLSVFWFEKTGHIVPSHLVSSDFEDFPPSLHPFRDQLADRSIIVKGVDKIRIEAVVRGYLAGSGWEEYRQGGAVCGHPLPGGLARSARLPAPIFTPATKEEAGEHDRNITFAECVEIVGEETAVFIREKSLALYRAAAEYALGRGIIIADTKFEFGYDRNRNIILIDEIFTPDSSRFWEQAEYEPGREQPGLDKQYVRDYLIRIDWNREPPVPQLPPEIVARTREKYAQIYRILTGETLFQ